MSSEYQEMFSRNIGLLSDDDQSKIKNAVVSIAGAGADGGLTAERVARLGVKTIKLADPENFDLSNINRQFASSLENVGKNKARAVGEELKKIRPDLNVEIYEKGVTNETIDDFLKDSTVVLDEIEYTLPKISILLHQKAREKSLNVFSGLNLGYGINVYKFSPDSIPLEQMLGIDLNSGDEEFKMESLVPNIPKYVDTEVVQKVLKGEMYIPAVSPAVGILAGYVSFVLLGDIIGKWEIPATPKYVHMDMLEMKFIIASVI